jgi:hypothetical protein
VGVSRVFERFAHLDLALPVDQLPWRSSPFMRGLRSLPVRYELTAPAEGAPPRAAEAGGTSTGDTAGTAEGADVAAAGQPEQRRSSLWRYLAGLIGMGG